MNLGIQLAASAALVVAMTLVHGIGIVGLSRLLGLDDKALKAHRLDLGALGLLVLMGLSLFALHTLEIALFALFYISVGALGSVEEALYFSESAYSTLGHPDVHFPNEWRLVGAFEGLVGFLLIGWSTAVFVTDMNKLLREAV